MTSPNPHSPPGTPPPDRRPWTPPEVAELPRLTDLTLVTGDPIDGSGATSGGGSVFS